MSNRINFFKAIPEGAKALMAVEAAINASGLEHSLAELVRLRASQINGCAFCIQMHVADAIEHGESHERIHLLSAWRESPVFTDRERAALAWAETLTRIHKAGAASDAEFELVRGQFTEAEIAWLSLLIGSINTWNRIQVGFKTAPNVASFQAA